LLPGLGEGKKDAWDETGMGAVKEEESSRLPVLLKERKALEPQPPALHSLNG
jgi:hypothetical protein